MPRTLSIPVIPSSLAIAALLAAPVLGQGAPRPGDRLPPVELEKLAQTPATAFSEFYGRAVLLDFFAYWCGPCAAAVPHLNELQREYGPQGLSVVGVTSEGPKKTEPWIAKYGAEYAYGYDPKQTLSGLFKVESIPFGALIDPSGVIVWTGDPRQLAPERLERALQGALQEPVWTWPEPARALAAPLCKGEYAKALEQAKELGGSDGFDPIVAVQRRVREELARFERLVGRADYVEAFELSERLKHDLAGLPEGESVAARVAALRQDPAVQAMLAAYSRMVDLETRAGAVRSLEEGEKLRPEIEALVKELEGKKLEKRAKALLQSVDRAIAAAKKRAK